MRPPSIPRWSQPAPPPPLRGAWFLTEQGKCTPNLGRSAEADGLPMGMSRRADFSKLGRQSCLQMKCFPPSSIRKTASRGMPCRFPPGTDEPYLPRAHPEPSPMSGDYRSGGLQQHPADDDLSRSQAFLAKLQAMDLPDDDSPEPAQPTPQLQPQYRDFDRDQQQADVPFQQGAQHGGDPPQAPPRNALQNGHLQQAGGEEMAGDIAAALAFARRRPEDAASPHPPAATAAPTRLEPHRPEPTHLSQDFGGPTSYSPPRSQGGGHMGARRSDQDGAGQQSFADVGASQMPSAAIRTGSPNQSAGYQPGPFNTNGPHGSPRGSPSARPASRITPGGPASPRTVSPSRVAASTTAFQHDDTFGSSTQPSSTPQGGFSESAWDVPSTSKPAVAEYGQPTGMGAQRGQPAATPAPAHDDDSEDDDIDFGGLMGPLAKRSGPAAQASQPTAKPAQAASNFDYGFADAFGASGAQANGTSASGVDDSAGFGGKSSPARTSQPPLSFGDSFGDAFGDSAGFGGRSSPVRTSQAPSVFGDSFGNAFGDDASFGGSSAFSEQKPAPVVAPPGGAVVVTQVTTKIEPPKPDPPKPSSGIAPLSAADLALMGKPSNRFPTYVPSEEPPAESPSSVEDSWGFESSSFGGTPSKPTGKAAEVASPVASSPMARSAAAAPVSAPASQPVLAGPMKPMKPSKATGPTASLVVGPLSRCSLCQREGLVWKACQCCTLPIAWVSQGLQSQLMIADWRWPVPPS